MSGDTDPIPVRAVARTASRAEPWRVAVVGAGPAGLALALHAARSLPQVTVTLFDARPIDRDVSGDARTLALSLGSMQDLERLGAWPADAAAAITEVHVSQAAPTWPPAALPPLLAALAGQAEVTIRAADLGVDRLGAVIRYGRLVSALQQRWLDAAANEPKRLTSRFGAPVQAVRALTPDVEGPRAEVEAAGVVERFDVAVIAEGGVFSEQPKKGWSRDYRQNAWVGEVELDGMQPGRAFERFTRQGPVALLPLPQAGRASLVWCTAQDDDGVSALDAAQRALVLQTLLPRAAGRVRAVGPLKCFPLGLNAERRTVEGGAVIRIGNAAQTLHPVAGQGLNLGLRDAAMLVMALADDRDRPADDPRPPAARMAALLDRLERRRLPDRLALVGATDFLARSFTWPWPGLGTARGLGLAIVQRVTPLRSALARGLMFGRR